MSLIKTEAIIIKSLNWSDTSKIVSLYTKDLGRIDVIAKGVRRKNHQYATIIESLNHIEIVLYVSEKRDLQNLGNITVINNFNSMRLDLDRMSVGYAILELLDTFFQTGEGDPVFFGFLICQFEALNAESQPLVVLWYFILKLLSYLGFKPHFEKCNSCGNLHSDEYYFQLTSGSVFCKNCIGDPRLFVTLTNENHQLLVRLQNANHRTISEFKVSEKFNFTQFNFLLDYMRLHTEQRIELNSLKLIY